MAGSPSQPVPAGVDPQSHAIDLLVRKRLVELGLPMSRYQQVLLWLMKRGPGTPTA